MKIEEHMKKAKGIENSTAKLDEEEDWQLIVEGVYGAALHYIAAICEKKIGKHLETHKGLPGFLDENGLSELATLFRQLDSFRVSRWYGKQGDGETVRLAREILERIKGEAHETRG
ncbi:MAG: hypothetical protein AB1468_01505 [Candidatus Micrarchaeota archaeon]